MRPRLLARCPHSNDPDAAAQVWRRHGGDDPPLEADGILLQGSALVCGEGSHDRLCQVENLGAGRELQLEGSHPERGEQIAIRCLGVLSSHMLQDEMCV